MKNVIIGDFPVGEPRTCLVVAEVGPNHNGSLEEALRLIDSVKESGCQAVKFQFRNAEKEIFDKSTTSYYFNRPRYDFIRDIQEFSFNEHLIIRRYAKEKELLYIASVMSEMLVDDLIRLSPDAIKIPSGEVDNVWLIESACKSGLPVIISSGMSNIDELSLAVSAAKKFSNKLIVLHCLSEYPTHLTDMNLSVIQTYRERFNIPVGLSDHSRQIIHISSSVIYGASLIEVHVTHDQSAEGPDHKISLLPAELRTLVDYVNQFILASGDGKKKHGPHYSSMVNTFSNSIVASRNIIAGEVLTRENLCLMKPGTGISPKNINLIIGKRTLVNICKFRPIQFEMLKP